MIERGIHPRYGSGKLLDETFFKGIVAVSGIDFTEVDLPCYDRRSAILVMSNTMRRSGRNLEVLFLGSVLVSGTAESLLIAAI